MEAILNVALRFKGRKYCTITDAVRDWPPDASLSLLAHRNFWEQAHVYKHMMQVSQSRPIAVRILWAALVMIIAMLLQRFQA